MQYDIIELRMTIWEMSVQEPTWKLKKNREYVVIIQYYVVDNKVVTTRLIIFQMIL